jgi:hypothetical protein
MSVFLEFTVSVSYLGFFAFPYVNFPFSSQIIVLKVSCALSRVAVFGFSSIHILSLLLSSSLCRVFLARSKDCYWLFLAVPNYRSVLFLRRFGSLFYRIFLSKANNRCCRFFSPNLPLVIVSSLVSQFFCNGHLLLLTSKGHCCRQVSSCPMRVLVMSTSCSMRVSSCPMRGPVFLSTSRRRCRVVPSVLHTVFRVISIYCYRLLFSVLGISKGCYRSVRIVSSNSSYNHRCSRHAEGWSWSSLLHGTKVSWNWHRLFLIVAGHR